MAAYVGARAPLPLRRRLTARSRLAGLLWRLGSERLTVWGRVWLLLMVVGASLGAPSLAIPIYKIWAATTAIFVVALPLGHLQRARRLRVTRYLPQQIAAGETVSYRVRV